jgi:hypothetical protein
MQAIPADVIWNRALKNFLFIEKGRDMSWSLNLFGNAMKGKAEYNERDNIGTRFTSSNQAAVYRLTNMNQGIREPCIDYCFKSEIEARSALAEVSCIKVAKDTGNLICTEIIKFGVFRRYPEVDNSFIAMLEGKALTREMWKQAKNAFMRHGGDEIIEIEPAGNVTTSKKAPGNPKAVKFSHEENRIVSNLPAIYRYYNGPDKVSAITFLQNNPVTKPSYFLVVKTPEGTFCRDVQGFFEG